MLIATLPPVYREELLREIISCDEVGGVRYNTGMVSPLDPEKTLAIVKWLTDNYEKKLWIDLKGRQLRVTHWAVPDLANITLNHEVEISGDAWVLFRDGEKCSVKFAHGNTIYLDPPPRQAVGAGQSINILGKDVTIKGYLTDNDRAYIQAAKKLGIKSFMLSFVESNQDIKDVQAEFGLDPSQNTVPTLDLVLKIESPAGMKFIVETLGWTLGENTLMAARDDLFATIGDDKSMILHYLKEIARQDPGAIVASRLFSGIERDGTLALSDITDIQLMKEFGYKNFMLSDGLCHRKFKEAIVAWKMIW